MASKANSAKIIAFLLVIAVGIAAGVAYFKEAASGDTPAKPKAETAANAAKIKIDPTLLTPKPADVILGDMNALATIVEYSSLSCPHCAHFHHDVLPDLQKKLITTGKAKLVLRQFPLNEPALRGAMLVDCAGKNGLERANFIKVLFEMQPQWAFDQDFLKNLKQIASVGGIDSAGFDSCMADKAVETKILAERKEAEEKLGIDSTPYFFVNGVKYEGERTAEGFSKAISGTANAPEAK